MAKSKIVAIPSTMEKFYGKGTMLHPTIEEIEQLIKTIPRGKVATIDALTKRLSKNHGTDVTCPMRTGNGIKKIAERYVKDNIDITIPFWRVIRSDQLVVKSKNQELSASLIQDEGFQLVFNTSGIKVQVAPNRLFLF